MVTAILVSALLAFLLGFLWYSPAMFGKAWLQAIGKKEEDVEANMGQHAVSIVGWLVAAFIYGFLITHIFINGIQDYLFLSVALWGAYMMPPKAMAMMKGGFNTKLLWIDGGYHLAGYILFAVIFRIFAG